MPFSYFVIQFDIKTFGKKNDLNIRLAKFIVYYTNELALRALWLNRLKKLPIYPKNIFGCRRMLNKYIFLYGLLSSCFKCRTFGN